MGLKTDKFSYDIANRVKKYAKRFFGFSVASNIIIGLIAFFSLVDIQPGLAFGIIILTVFSIAFNFLIAFLIHMLGGFYENSEKTVYLQRENNKLLEELLNNNTNNAKKQPPTISEDLPTI